MTLELLVAQHNKVGNYVKVSLERMEVIKIHRHLGDEWYRGSTKRLQFLL